MGKLIYGSNATEVEFDDRVLVHLRRAIVVKLRRNESFTLTWKNGVDAGSGHSCIWLHPAIPLQFVFHGNRDPSLNRNWVEMLVRSANNQGDMQIVPEPADS